MQPEEPFVFLVRKTLLFADPKWQQKTVAAGKGHAPWCQCAGRWQHATRWHQSAAWSPGWIRWIRRKCPPKMHGFGVGGGGWIFFFFLPVLYASVELMMEHGVPSLLFWFPLSFRVVFHFYEYLWEKGQFFQLWQISHNFWLTSLKLTVFCPWKSMVVSDDSFPKTGPGLFSGPRCYIGHG